jgi:hypothetical protein
MGSNTLFLKSSFPLSLKKRKKYWHPHNGEILSGQLVGPNIPIVAEKH